MKLEVKKYLTEKFNEYGIKLSLKNISEDETLFYLILFKEGMEIPLHVLKQFLKYSKDILDVKDIKSRINELKAGEINLDDFASGVEMAEYLENGIVV